MSCIYFHSRDDGEVRLSGRERHFMGGLVDDLMMGVIGKGDWILQYLPKEAELFFKNPRERSLFSAWLRHDDKACFIVDGKEAGSFHVALNTAIALGNDVIKLAAKLHGQCEVHCWVDGPNRKWLADIMQDGLDLNIFRTGEGWEDVIEFMSKSTSSPVVCSYSVCERFPNFESLPADHPLRREVERRTDDERFDLFYEMDQVEAWDACMDGIRGKGGLELRPETWSEIRFGAGISIFDMMKSPVDAFLAKARDVLAKARGKVLL